MTVRPSRIGLLVAATLLTGATPKRASGQLSATDPAKVVLIRRVLELTKVGEVMAGTIEAAIPAQRVANPQIPAAFWDEFVARARHDAPQFIEALIPIYDAEFTTAQLEELVRFYQSPLGRHLVEVQPVIAAQSMRAGQQWGVRLGSQVAQELGRRGVRMPRP